MTIVIVRVREQWDKKVGYRIVKKCCHTCVYSQPIDARSYACLRVGGMVVSPFGVCNHWKETPTVD